MSPKRRIMFPLISIWTIREGQEKAAIAALQRLVAQEQSCVRKACDGAGLQEFREASEAPLFVHADRGQGRRKDKLAVFDCGVFDPAGGIYPTRRY